MNFAKVLLVVILVLASTTPSFARKKKNKEADKQTAVVNTVKVQPKPRVHPALDDKVVGQFKDADKVRARIQAINGLDKDQLKAKLDQLNAEQKIKTQKITRLREQELARTQERKRQLAEAKASLEKKGLDSNMINGLFNKVGLFVNDAQMKQIKTQEASLETQIQSSSESLAITELIKSYVDSKVSN